LLFCIPEQQPATALLVRIGAPLGQVRILVAYIEVDLNLIDLHPGRRPAYLVSALIQPVGDSQRSITTGTFLKDSGKGRHKLAGKDREKGC
jgi:hypothetical protein